MTIGNLDYWPAKKNQLLGFEKNFKDKTVARIKGDKLFFEQNSDSVNKDGSVLRDKDTLITLKENLKKESSDKYKSVLNFLDEILLKWPKEE